MPPENEYTTPSDTGYGPTSNPGPGIGQATIDAPPTEDKGKQLDLEARSVKTIGHAWNICKATEQSNRTRAARTADMQSLYDGAPPRSAGMNLEKAKNWQSNASTSWLAGIVGRVAQRFVNAIVSQLYVTSSSLSESTQNWKEKTDLMRAKFTALVRSWNGYTGFINAECVETVLQGYCYAVFLDPYTWKPTFFKQDWAYCPDYSGQHARDLQFFVAKLDYRLDEFIRLFRDEKSAEAVGYDTENCVWAANNAQMINPPTDATTTQFRTFVEMINEGVLGLTYTQSGARIVPTYLLFNREYDGKVSFWLVHRDSGKQLRMSFKLFPTMEDAISIFSFEPGNGCIHSSKGLGRKLCALAIMKEVFRNSIIDNARISGLMVVRTSAGDLTKIAPKMLSPFIYLDSSVEIPNQQFQANGDTYEMVDKLIDGWAEQSVGAYIPVPINETQVEKTATQAQIDARRESEAADIQIRRQLDQFSNMTQIQQIRAFSDDNIKSSRQLFERIAKQEVKRTKDVFEGHQDADPEVIRTLVEIMESGDITDDEIKEWRDSPASPYAHVAEAALQNGLMMAAEQFKGNPNVDQTKLNYRKLEGLVGAEAASDLFIPMPDQTVVAEAVRQQRIESSTMMNTLVPIPASARDNLLIHGTELQNILTGFYGTVLSDVNADPKLEKSAELNLNHLGEHLGFATPEELKNPKIKELEKFYESFKKNLAESVQIRASAKAAQAAVTQNLRMENGGGSPEAAGVAGPLPTSPQIAPFELPQIPPRTGPTREPVEEEAVPA